MSLSGFGRTIGSLLKPSRRLTRARLVELFRDHPGREYTTQQLYLLVRPVSVERLAGVLDDLTREGLIRRVYRVESPRSRGGIRDFKTIAEIPNVLHDWTVDEDIEVEPSLVRPYFKTLRA